MYTPLNIVTHYSILKGFSKPEEIVKKCSKMNLNACAITDYDSMSGAVTFFNTCTKAGIKPILGTKIWINDDNGYVTLYAKNYKGWKSLIKLTTLANLQPRPSISFSDLVGNASDIIVTSGEYNSTLMNCVVKDYRSFALKVEQLSSFFQDDYEKITERMIDRYKSSLPNFFVSVQRNAVKECSIEAIVSDIVSKKAALAGIKVLAGGDVLYSEPKYKEDSILLACSANKINTPDLSNFILKDEGSLLAKNYMSNNLYLLEMDKLQNFYSDEEIGNTQLINDMCEKYNILSQPKPPKYPCPNNVTEAEYLRQLCRNGWKRLEHTFDSSRKEEYVDRVNKELAVFEEAGISGYFLIVQDYVNWAKERMLVGTGRGSALGCLVSYLTGITAVDPIKYDLFFERFYNKGRNSPGNISYPDIDVDFPVNYRESVIDYITQRYGRDYIAQVVTFSTLQGRGALSEVFRLKEVMSASQIQEISKLLPARDKISDKLEEQKEDSIIRWTLRNEPALLADYAYMDNDENIKGEYAEYFNQAIRLEGTIKGTSKHASAVVVSSEKVGELAPMMPDKNSDKSLLAIEFKELEQLGGLKLDILGLSQLDKCMAAKELIEYGEIRTKVGDINEYEP